MTTAADRSTGEQWLAHDLDGRPGGTVARGTIRRPVHRSNSRPVAGTIEHEYAVRIVAHPGDSGEVLAELELDGQPVLLDRFDLKHLALVLAAAAREIAWDMSERMRELVDGGTYGWWLLQCDAADELARLAAHRERFGPSGFPQSRP